MQQAQQALSKNLDALRKEINLFDSRLKLMKQRCEQTAYAIVSDINAVKK
jgi:flagellar biosynthesis/type III secretory pathway chaperone